jgi:hypothetical protein
LGPIGIGDRRNHRNWSRRVSMGGGGPVGRSWRGWGLGH